MDFAGSEDFSAVLLAVVVFPVLLGVVRVCFSDELLYWSGVLSYYLRRPFDLDSDPDTPDWCMLFNPGDGTWSYCSLTYRFGFFRSQTGVFVHRYDPVTWDLVCVQPVSFAAWAGMSKAFINLNAVPGDLLRGPMRGMSSSGAVGDCLPDEACRYESDTCTVTRGRSSRSIGRGYGSTASSRAAAPPVVPGYDRK